MSNEFIHEVKVYYEDTDSGGVVYYSNYLKFFYLYSIIFVETSQTSRGRRCAYQRNSSFLKSETIMKVKQR